MNPAPATASANAPRPIRFVTNHEGPYAKRRRINSACLTCRRKKTRCSGALTWGQAVMREATNECVKANGLSAGHARKTNTNVPDTATTRVRPKRQRTGRRLRVRKAPPPPLLPSTSSRKPRHSCHTLRRRRRILRIPRPPVACVAKMKTTVCSLDMWLCIRTDAGQALQA